MEPIRGEIHVYGHNIRPAAIMMGLLRVYAGKSRFSATVRLNHEILVVFLRGAKSRAMRRRGDARANANARESCVFERHARHYASPCVVRVNNPKITVMYFFFLRVFGGKTCATWV